MPASDEQGPFGRILVVEDERIVALDLAATLTELGYVVVDSVSTGEEAVACASDVPPDVVLMDIRLAGRLDGIEAADQIRRTRDVPVIYLTAHADPDTLRRAKGTAPFAYLVKPFKAVELRCAIEIALHKHEIDRRLREREQWLAATLHSIADGVVTTDTQSNVTLINPVAEALTGWRHHDALGRRVEDIMQLVTDHGGDTERPSERVFEQRAAAIVDPSGGLVGGVVVLRDVSEQRRAEDELRRANAEIERQVGQRVAALEAANHELEAFSASVAHDLRAPLRHIDGFSQVLIEDHAANLGHEGVDLLRRVRSATGRMSQLVDDLLRLARVGETTVARKLVDVSAIARMVVDALRARHRDRGVTVSIDPGIAIEADAGLIQIALENLLDNAWKFTSAVAQPQITVGALDDAGVRGMFIRDNGAGFDAEHALKLFGAFQRFHPSSEFEGNGMGLAIVERIVKRHDGRIWVDSRPGAGATFYLVV